MSYVLTDVERLILSNQYAILAKLADSQHEAEEYEKLASHLNKGYSFFYGDALRLQQCERVSDAVQQFVMDVLSMYRALQRVVEDGSVSDEVKADLIFPGFDGNEEYQYMGFAMALYEQGRYPDVFGFNGKDPDFNSHSPTLDLYQRMLSKWIEFGKEPELDLQQVQDILEEQDHPESR